MIKTITWVAVIDTAKDKLDIAVHGQAAHWQVENTVRGWRRLQATIARVYAMVPFYRQRLEEAGITPGDISSLQDLESIPFTTKQDLRDNYPFGTFAVPMDNVVRIHASSGTTGQPELEKKLQLLISGTDLAITTTSISPTCFTPTLLGFQ